MITVRLNNKKFKLPSSWAECSRAHALTFVSMIFHSGLKELDLDNFSTAFKLRVLRAMISDHKVDDDLFFGMKSYQVMALTDQISYMFTEPCMEPIVKSLPGGLYLPDARMSNSTFIEFAFADEFFTRIGTEHDDGTFLDKLVLSLCRPIKKYYAIRRLFGDKDPRRRFDSSHLDASIKDMPQIYKSWVYFFYLNFRKHLVSRYKNIFSYGDYMEEASSGDHGWLGILTSLAKEGIFGPWEATARSNVHTVLFALSYNQDMYQEALRKSKRKNQ